jgi:hypothetical protein
MPLKMTFPMDNTLLDAGDDGYRVIQAFLVGDTLSCELRDGGV